jgi:hypothetical protein
VYFVNLLHKLSACVHDDAPQVGTGGHTADVQTVLPALLHVHQQAAGVDVVVVSARCVCVCVFVCSRSNEGRGDKLHYDMEVPAFSHHQQALPEVCVYVCA